MQNLCVLLLHLSTQFAIPTSASATSKPIKKSNFKVRDIGVSLQPSKQRPQDMQRQACFLVCKKKARKMSYKPLKGIVFVPMLIHRMVSHVVSHRASMGWVVNSLAMVILICM